MRRGEPLVHRSSRVLRRPEVVHVLGNLLPRGVEQCEQHDAAAKLRIALEQPPECLEAADRVLRGIRAVDAHHEDLRAIRLEVGAARPDRVTARELLELGSVDRDRVCVGSLLRLGSPTEECLAALDERARHRSVWKPTLSHARRPSCTARASHAGTTAQRSGPTHGMCTKCAIRAAGRAERTSPGAT